MSNSVKRRRHSPEFKAKVALAAARGDRTLNELAKEYAVSPVQISQWKRQLLQEAPRVFGRQERQVDPEALAAPLYQEIGRLKMELDWLKKKWALSVEDKQRCIEPHHPDLSLRRQCALLGLPRSSWYYAPARERAENLELMRLIDQQYLRTPFYRSRRMCAWLRSRGYPVNRKRVQRLMRRMGLEGLAPKPGTSQRHPEHTVYPYLLRGLPITGVNQVWSTDVTYCALRQGFMYLVAVIDWYSRYVLSWQLSNTLETAFCLEALDQALASGRPQIFNTDQGCQFTSQAFTGRLQQHGIRISMDGRGRALDNIFVERLWRSVKYECLYLHDIATVSELREKLADYFTFYNHERLHQALDYRTPHAVHHG